MTRPSLRAKLSAFAGFLDGVRECAGAGRAGQTPSRESLRRLGIDHGDSVRN